MNRSPSANKKVISGLIIFSLAVFLPVISVAQQEDSSISDSDAALIDSSNATADSVSAIGQGVNTAIKQCTGAGGALSGALNSLIKNIGGAVGGPAGGLINSAAGSVTGAASGAINQAIGGAAQGIGGAIVGGAENLIKDIGVSFGSQGIVDFGSSISSFFGGGMGGLGGGITGAFGAIMGGGGPIPTDPVTASPNIAALKKKETCDDAIAFAIAHNIALPDVIAKATNYINAGNNGNPFYPRNPGDYYQNVANNQTRVLLGQIQGSNSPFKNQLVPTVIQANRNKAPNSFEESLAPRLDGLIGPDAAARFRAGDTSVCPGKLYYTCLQIIAMSPGDSSLLSQMATLDESEEEQAKAENEAREELYLGGGFAPDKECVDFVTDDDTGDVTCLRMETKTPGIVIAEQAKEVATNAIKEARNVHSAGEELPPFFKRFADQILAGGLSFLSNALRGGAAASISSYRLQTNNQVNSAIGTAVGNTTTYRSILENEAIPTASSTIRDLNSTNVCYSALESLNDDDNVTRPAAVASEIALISNYQIIFTGYQTQLAGIIQNPNQATSDVALAELVSQTNVLKGKQATIAGYLSSCRDQALAAGAINQTSSGQNENPSGGGE